MLPFNVAFSRLLQIWPLPKKQVMAFWMHRTDGTIHTAADDQDSDWRPPTLSERDLDGSWDFVLSGVPPSFVLRNVQGGSGSDGDSTDATTADGTQQIVTANGTFGYSGDWNHIERLSRPTHAAANLLHYARQRTDASRWWSMRWPSGAASLVGRSLNLGTGRTYKLMRQLREHSTTYLTKVLQLSVDRTGERDNTAARHRLQAEWAETKRRLRTQGRNAKRQLMPGWAVVEMLPLCKLKRQLAAWKRVRAKVILRGGQRTITSFMAAAPRPHIALPTGTTPNSAPARTCQKVILEFL